MITSSIEETFSGSRYLSSRAMRELENLVQNVPIEDLLIDKDKLRLYLYLFATGIGGASPKYCFYLEGIQFGVLGAD